MIKRVLNFGCSHAWGSEMSGKGNDEGSYELNFGKHVADYFGVPFLRCSQPGTSNKYAYHCMMEIVEEGDLVLNSIIQAQRFMYHKTSYDNVIGSSHITPYEITKVAEHIYDEDKLLNFTKVLPILNIRKMLDEHHKIIQSSGIKFIDYGNAKIAQKITEWAINYHYEYLPLFINFLETYNAQQSLCKERGAMMISWTAQEHPEFLKWTEEYNDKTPIYKNTTQNENHPPYSLHETKLYKNWKNDPARISPQKDSKYIALLELIHRKNSGEKFTLPGDRLGHYGPEEHKDLADILIAKAKELGYG